MKNRIFTMSACLLFIAGCAQNDEPVSGQTSRVSELTFE